MKRKVMLITMIVVFVLGTTVSVSAIYRNDSYEGRMIKRGYTEEDMLNLNAVLYLSEEIVKGLILQKYDELEDWKKVREYYSIDEEKYENYMIGKRIQQETLNSIPSYIFDEMDSAGWTKSQVSDFVNKVNIHQINSEYAWKECKSGGTIDDVVKEKKHVDNERADLDTEFVYGEMTVQEYESKLTVILGKGIVRKTDNMISNEAKEIDGLRRRTRQRHKESSGITEEEIKYCESKGITNPMDMYQAKNISKGNKVSFEKVVDSKIKHKDWTRATAEALGISHEEYKRQNEIAKSK